MKINCSNLQCFLWWFSCSWLSFLGLLLFYLLCQLLLEIILNSIQADLNAFVDISNKIENPVDFLAFDVMDEPEMNCHLSLFDEVLEVRLVHPHKSILRLEIELSNGKSPRETEVFTN